MINNMSFENAKRLAKELSRVIMGIEMVITNDNSEERGKVYDDCLDKLSIYSSILNEEIVLHQKRIKWGN